jgi:hypothetical protein
MLGKTWTQEQAGQLLLSYVDSPDLGDRFYEFVQDLCNKAIDDIESKHEIENNEIEDDVMWYDDYREDFMKAMFEKIQDGKF